MKAIAKSFLVSSVYGVLFQRSGLVAVTTKWGANMISMRAKSLPLLASMAAIAVTAVPGFAQDAKLAANDLQSKLHTCLHQDGTSYETQMACAINALDADTARLKKEGDAADAAGDCIKYLTAGVKSGAFNKAEIVQKAAGKLNVSNACPIAIDYGYGKKAEAAPGLN